LVEETVNDGRIAPLTSPSASIGINRRAMSPISISGWKKPVTHSASPTDTVIDSSDSEMRRPSLSERMALGLCISRTTTIEQPNMQPDFTES